MTNTTIFQAKSTKKKSIKMLMTKRTTAEWKEVDIRKENTGTTKSLRNQKTPTL
jgi:hypothetical protein